MPASLTWIDHNPAERERMLRVLAMLQQRETRDELGLGAIRDALADKLFPGTSTIQTRLRYMLFVPWVYRQLEARGVRSSQVEAEGRKLEMALVIPLMEKEDWGVFGRTAGNQLRRLPSSVYWQGLGSWHIRQFRGSREQYHRALDGIYRQRRARSRRYDGDGGSGGAFNTWHPALPPAPEGFPHGVDFRLTPAEAEFIRDRIATSHRGSLLAFLALYSAPADAAFPWMHPDLATFPAASRELLENARLFSDAMNGASILYNLMLAEAAQRADYLESHRTAFRDWAVRLDIVGVARWNLSRLWMSAAGTAHTVTRHAQSFVEGWVGCIRNGVEGLEERPEARSLVRQRERWLKGDRSRFTNLQARDRWNGRAGIEPMSFRWRTVSGFLSDLHAAGRADD